MHEEINKNTKWSKYFVSYVSFKNINLNNGLNVISRMIYSLEARKKLSYLLDNFTPDIAHVHNIYHQISPSIISELKKRNIPIIHTVGDYHLISPHHNNLFHNGNICEVTKKHRYYNAIIHKCVKNSYIASFVEVLEQYIHWVLGLYTKNVDYYISPSTFLKHKLIEHGFPESKLLILPYFIESKKYDVNFSKKSYVLYFGRLSPEKGLRFLLTVMKFLPHIQLKVIGKGSEGEVLKMIVKKENIQNIQIIDQFIPEYLLRRFLNKSAFVILPSISMETFGISILESFASGKPIVASRIGAIPETIKDGYNGFLFESGNVDDCAEKISKLWNNPTLCKKMGKNARKYVEKNFSSEEHYKKLMNIYKKAIELHI
ncbi:MAG: glycosyltransferase family 4 protein, partial [Patescibacteria group bacterium]